MVFLRETYRPFSSFHTEAVAFLCPGLAELISSSEEEETVLFLPPTVSPHCSVWETSGTSGALYPALGRYTDLLTSH